MEPTEDNELSPQQLALLKAQAAFPKYKKPGEVWSEEIIEERRLEAARERDI